MTSGQVDPAIGLTVNLQTNQRDGHEILSFLSSLCLRNVQSCESKSVFCL